MFDVLKAAFVLSAMMTRRILIIDDDPMMRELLETVFIESEKILSLSNRETNVSSPTKRYKYLTKTAPNGIEGLEIIKKDSEIISAIILDLVMPKMGGIEVLSQINELGLTDKIPVFINTGSSDSNLIETAYQLGAVDVLTKPFRGSVILHRVNAVLELFEHRKALYKKIDRQDKDIVESYKRLSEIKNTLIESLATAIEFRDGESGDHVHRIHELTYLLLKKTSFGDGLSEDTINTIAVAATLHDVGKVSIPDSILSKPGKLTEEEFEIMKTHSEKGALMFDKIKGFRDLDLYRYCREIALGHHERWDGGGYPRHLKGSEIPKWVQVVSIVDVIDALVNDRCYKPKFSFDQAFDMIRNNQCGVFNPELVKEVEKVRPEIESFYRDIPEN